MSEKPEDVLYFAEGMIEATDKDIRRLHTENERLREELRRTTVSLVAAVSLLKSGGKKAAPSKKMFNQMLADYTNSIERSRAVLQEPPK